MNYGRENLSFKTSKTLTGIETYDSYFLNQKLHLRFKTSKTLTGIETTDALVPEVFTARASKHLKPLQGLKPAGKGLQVDLAFKLQNI